MDSELIPPIRLSKQWGPPPGERNQKRISSRSSPKFILRIAASMLSSFALSFSSLTHPVLDCQIYHLFIYPMQSAWPVNVNFVFAMNRQAQAETTIIARRFDQTG
jgi:hypothetical protein